MLRQLRLPAVVVHVRSHVSNAPCDTTYFLNEFYGLSGLIERILCPIGENSSRGADMVFRNCADLIDVRPAASNRRVPTSPAAPWRRRNGNGRRTKPKLPSARTVDNSADSWHCLSAMPCHSFGNRSMPSIRTAVAIRNVAELYSRLL